MWLFVARILPVRIAKWDPRYLLAQFRTDHVLDAVHDHLAKLGIQPLEIVPYPKDGGLFVRYDPATTTLPAQEQLADFPTWLGAHTGHAWSVEGNPWPEDMNRFASPIVRVTFDGPDVKEQVLYDICRKYGRIRDISSPLAVPAGTPRSATVTFTRITDAAVARNVLHGLTLPSSSGSTILRISYDKPIQAHAVRSWISGHPKIVIPILFFLLGTLTYTVFDPFRSLMVQANLLDWFEYKKYKVYKLLRLDSLEKQPRLTLSASGQWKDRTDADAAIRNYLSDMPTTVAFVHGPQGSGKTSMLKHVIEDGTRSALIIDCRPLLASPDSQLIPGLASQTGYWPVFSFFNSMSNLLDIASVALIGQKSGLSSSLPDQLRQILNTVTKGLRATSSRHRSYTAKRIAQAEQDHQLQLQNLERKESIINGTWHDGRLDCVAGNGVMSELGGGDEPFDPQLDSLSGKGIISTEEENQIKLDARSVRQQQSEQDLDAINALPIVVIRNYATTVSSSTNEELLNALAAWAAYLAENQIAHVLVLSDNRENSKRLAKALPSKPLVSIGLSDADAASSLAFVKQKLTDSGVDSPISSRQASDIERLGGRTSDLETLIHKVRGGMSVDSAVEDIISRGVVELRKNAFGDDADDAKGLPWTREQAWRLVSLLAKSSEIPYYDVLIEFPFKGDEAALRSMEHADLISIGTVDGRASVIRPGKPVFKYVFERLAKDRVFAATQELSFNDKQIVENETKIKSYEQELSLLRETMKNEQRSWWDTRKSPCKDRARAVGEKLVLAQRKVEQLERKNKDLKKTIAAGDLRR